MVHQLFIIRLSVNRPNAELLFLQLVLAVLHFFFKFAAASMQRMMDMTVKCACMVKSDEKVWKYVCIQSRITNCQSTPPPPHSPSI